MRISSPGISIKYIPYIPIVTYILHAFSGTYEYTLEQPKIFFRFYLIYTIVPKINKLYQIRSITIASCWCCTAFLVQQRSSFPTFSSFMGKFSSQVYVTLGMSTYIITCTSVYIYQYH